MRVNQTTEDSRRVTPFGVVEEAPRTAREAVQGMVEAGLFDDLFKSIDAGGLQLTGADGFLPEMIKAVLERGLKAELTEHLGYEHGERTGGAAGNARNGSTPKTVATEVGEVTLNGPRDRNATFEPRLVPKGARRLGGLDEVIISLYAGGMTVRDIQHHLGRTTAPSCPTRRSPRSPTRSSRRSASGRRDRWRRSTRSSISTPSW
jgi:putative transposase